MSLAYIGQKCDVNADKATIDLDGAALTSPVLHRTHDSALTAGDLVDGRYYKWTVYKDPNIVSLIVGKLNSGATDTISDITWFDDIGTINALDTNLDIVLLGSANSIWINGIRPYWVSNTEVGWTGGEAFVDGKVLVFAPQTTGTMTSGSSDGLSASGVWCHYLYDNSGTPAIEMVQEGTTFPKWDSALEYYGKGTATTNDLSRRLIGWHQTYLETTYKVTHFGSYGEGNNIEINHTLSHSDQFRLQSGVLENPPTVQADNTWLAADNAISVAVPSVCHQVAVAIKISGGSTNNDLNARASGWDMTGLIDTAGPEISVRGYCLSGDYMFFPAGWVHTPTTTVYLYHNPVAATGSVSGFLADCYGGRLRR